MELQIVARVHSPFGTKFGVPRQSGLAKEVRSELVFEPPFRDPEALRGIEGFSHLWLIWEFSENADRGWSPTVRPPRLGGNARMGVFATRSPFRPNALGLSCVELAGVEKHPELGTVLRIRGGDMMDGTPVYDVKPYVPYADCRPQARSGFAPDPGGRLAVEYAPGTAEMLPEDKRAALTGILANDPRPRYQKDGERVYTMDFAGAEIKFTGTESTIRVVEVSFPGG